MMQAPVVFHKNRQKINYTTLKADYKKGKADLK
jgi:hypothetical protein